MYGQILFFITSTDITGDKKDDTKPNRRADTIREATPLAGPPDLPEEVENLRGSGPEVGVKGEEGCNIEKGKGTNKGNLKKRENLKANKIRKEKET